MRAPLLTLTSLLLAGTALGQGSLTPTGAPSAGMKTLAQVESRTPISAPGHTITNAGSYYLTTNLLWVGSRAYASVANNCSGNGVTAVSAVNGVTRRNVSGTNNITYKYLMP